MNLQPVSLRDRFAGLFVVALTLGAVDTLLTRLELDHRPLDVWLFVEACVAWFALALLALVPALLVDAWLFRRGRIDASRARAAARHAAWTALPVVIHAQINPYTELGGKTAGLETFAPWRDALIALALIGGCTWLVCRLVALANPTRLAWIVVAASCATGAFVSFHHAPPPNPTQAAAGKPNVLLLVWDTTRAQSLELYGYDRPTTPNLAKLANDALVFSDSRSVATYTLTSHVSLLTGVYPSNHGARMTRQRFNPKATPSAAEAFHAAGYRTGAFVGTDVLHAQTGVSWNFEVFDDQVDPAVCYTHLWAFLHDVQAVLALWRIHRNNDSPHWFQDFQRPATEVLADAQAWIDNGDARPWFCMINLYDAHWPYLPEDVAREQWVRPYSGAVDGFSWRGDNAPLPRDMTDADDAHLSDLYDAELAQLDGEVDAFVSKLDTRKTAIVMTSDHGEAFGEGGQYDHGNILECQVHVPLIVRPAGGVQKRVIDTPTSGIDIAPTLLSLAALPPEHKYRGRDLLGDLSQPRPLLVEDRDHYDPFNIQIALYDGPWKLVRAGIGPKAVTRLFDLSNDALGLKNIASEHEDVVQRMTKELDEYRGQWGANDEQDAATRGPMNDAAMRQLGYFGKAEPVSDAPAAPSPAGTAKLERSAKVVQ